MGRYDPERLGLKNPGAKGEKDPGDNPMLDVLVERVAGRVHYRIIGNLGDDVPGVYLASRHGEETYVLAAPVRKNWLGMVTRNARFGPITVTVWHGDEKDYCFWMQAEKGGKMEIRYRDDYCGAQLHGETGVRSEGGYKVLRVGSYWGLSDGARAFLLEKAEKATERR